MFFVGGNSNSRLLRPFPVLNLSTSNLRYSIKMASRGKEKKSALQHGDKHDKLNISDYTQAIASLESFRQ